MSGAVPLTFGQVNDWCDGRRVELYPTERDLIVALSNAYVSQLNKSDNPDELPPAALDDEGIPDYGYLGDMHISSRDKKKEEEAAK
ncbi:MAG: hypothetical protein ACPHUL_00800 [Marinomonas gallaica]